jgi:hypothetical protein
MASKAEKRTGVWRDGEKVEWQKGLDKWLYLRYILYREKYQK